MAREGLEPSKPLGRQIYSLLRLTASLPRQLAVCIGNGCFRCFLDAYKTGKAVRWSWRRELNPRPADYKSAALPTELRQPRQKVNFSTTCASHTSDWARWLWTSLEHPGNLLLYTCSPRLARLRAPGWPTPYVAERPQTGRFLRQRPHSGSARAPASGRKPANRSARGPGV